MGYYQIPYGFLIITSARDEGEEETQSDVGFLQNSNKLLHGIAVLETGGSAVCDAGMGNAGAPGGEMALVFGFRHGAADDGDLEVFEVVAIDNFIVRLYMPG